jgi:CRP-like cAMP-binding protein
MPKVGTYRANSVIYFQGDQADRIFVLQKGRVSLNYNDIETGKPIHEIIQTGEFFGVKSAMGHYPREENAVVQEDANVLIFSVPEFEVFAASNIRIILKMLKVFSNQLRRIHRQVENLMENPVTVNAELGLYKTGEYYLKNRMFSQTRYVMSRYLTYYPAGKMAEQAAHHLEAAESALSRYGDGRGPAPMAVSSMAGSSGREEHSGGAALQEAARPQDGQRLSDTAKEYYNAVSLFSQEKYKEALRELKRIAEEAPEPEYAGKAMFDIGRCLFALAQWDLAIKHYTSIIQSTPKHPDMADILFIMGQCWEKKGDIERAKGFYKKVLSMPGDEDASARIKAKKTLNALGGA